MRISVCHCLACQQRTGSAFGVQARWPQDEVRMSGEFRTWSRVGDAGGRATYRFCDTCGSTVAYVNDGLPGLIAIAVGAFADPGFPPPRFSVYEDRKHGWVAVLGEAVEHLD
ncbi:GFA family protein [Phenylobacterium sp.]|uniref:GFA family protein n=1 Tax=Phenylobacterium sp. TaxID=1871053 RepID=UPI002F95FA28